MRLNISSTSAHIHRQVQGGILAYLSISTVPTRCAKYHFFESGAQAGSCCLRYLLQIFTRPAPLLSGKGELPVLFRYLKATWSPPPLHTHLHLQIRCYIHAGAKLASIQALHLPPCSRLPCFPRPTLAPCTHTLGTVHVRYYSTDPSRLTPPPSPPGVSGCDGAHLSTSSLAPLWTVIMRRPVLRWAICKRLFLPQFTRSEPASHISCEALASIFRILQTGSGTRTHTSRSISPRVAFQALRINASLPRTTTPYLFARRTGAENHAGEPVRIQLSGITTKA